MPPDGERGVHMHWTKPKMLQKGDTVAAVSPSWGAAGAPDIHWKYRVGVRRLEKEFGLHVIAAPNALKPENELENHPELRASDINWAFQNPDIDAVFCNIGGNDSVRILPFVDFKAIKDHPKIFLGYSDNVCMHMACCVSGLSSFYGPNIITTIAENGGMHEYTKHWIEKELFCSAPVGELPPAGTVSFDGESYAASDAGTPKTYVPNRGVQCLQGNKTARGHLIGGNSQLKKLQGTKAALTPALLKGAVFFYEDICWNGCEEITGFFDWMGARGYLGLLNGIILGKFCPNDHTPFLHREIRRIVCEKYGRSDLPILAGLNFGHTSPMLILPYGAQAEIDCAAGRFSILESTVCQADSRQGRTCRTARKNHTTD